MIQWKKISAICLVPIFWFHFTIIGSPETPYYLCSKGIRYGYKAEKSLYKYRTPRHNLETEMNDIRLVEIRARFVKSKVSKVLLTAIMVIFLHHFNLINQMVFPSKNIYAYRDNGFEDFGTGYWKIFAVACNQIFFSLLSAALVDKFGRKKLLLCSNVGQIISLAVLLGFANDGIPEDDPKSVQLLKDETPIVARIAILHAYTATYSIGIGKSSSF